ncbi:T-box transcription factor TBX22 [Erpetoichthys calabaricus]|uniref:T-box transcription factor TBX22 n=1 Tax=Erpetoichthys calabaricus TaxID=27687 RepID=UPI0022347B45|nr:T-box transcription factor TBX22 [Erpetoichthys calabaricus]
MALSSRAHAFSVESLVGKSPKRKGDHTEKEKIMNEASGLLCEKKTDRSAAATESGKKRKSDTGMCKAVCSDSEKDVQVELQGLDLWKRFHEIGTEMIITKAGRRMFPSVRVKVKDLDPFKQYYIAMDIIPVDSKRYRYVYHSSQWMVAGNTDHSCITPRLYIHPDSPCSGETWMRQVISFDRVKLTNNEMDDKGHIILQSMHKYKPRVHVIVHSAKLDLAQIHSLPDEGVKTFIFKETEFTTVTAYQNQQITKLKIDRNPFAKGFRDPGRNRGVLDGILETYPWRSPLSLDLKHFGLEAQGRGTSSPLSCGTPPSISGLPSSPCSFGLPCSNTSLHSLTIPLSYKLYSPSLGGSHPFSPADHDRLQESGSVGVQVLADFPFLESFSIPQLRDKKKGVDCKGPCIQELPGPTQHLYLRWMHEAGSAGLPASQLRQDSCSLLPHYSLCNYDLSMASRLSSMTRHFKLAEAMPLTPREGQLCHKLWNSPTYHLL